MTTPVDTGLNRERDRQERVRKAARATVISKLNRMLIRRPTKVMVRQNGPYGAAAWTDGNDVFLAPHAMEAPWADLLGANYHEIAHILYTPSRNTKLVKRVLENGAFRAFNLLEDMRIETLMVDRWRPLVGFYTLMFNRFVVDGTSQIDRAYLYATGRRYLPVELRAKFRAAYWKPSDLAEIDRLVAEYVTLNPRRDADRMVAISIRYQDLLNEARAAVHEHITDISTSGDVGSKELDEQTDRIGEVYEFDQKELEEAFGDLFGDAGDESGDDAEAEADDPAGGGQDEGEDDGSEPDDSTSDVASSAAGDGSPERNPEDLWQDILEDLKELSDEVKPHIDELAERYEEAEKQEIDRILDDYEVGAGLDKTRNFTSTQQVDSEQHRTARRLSKKFDRLVDELAPTWERQHKSGRIDFRSVMQAQRDETALRTDVFRRWKHGSEDMASIEVGIAVDMSGSMAGSRIASAARTLWTIRRMFDLFTGEANVSVVGFDTSAYPLFGHKDRPQRSEYPVPKTLGGTRPSVAVMELSERFKVSGASHRFLFIITDGWFHDRDITAGLVNILRRDHGVHTAVVGISGTDVSDHESWADEVATINRMDDLLPMIDRLVTKSLQDLQTV